MAMAVVGIEEEEETDNSKFDVTGSTEVEAETNVGVIVNARGERSFGEGIDGEDETDV